MLHRAWKTANIHLVNHTGNPWRGTALSFQLLGAVAGQKLVAKQGPQCYSSKEMNFAHSLSLEEGPKCQVEAEVLVNTLVSGL